MEENQPSGTVVGNLSATDPDAGQTHTFSLVTGAGSTDNTSFAILGNELRTAEVFDFETKSSYSIRVRATDNGAPPLFFEKQFTVTITDTTEPPVVTTSGGNTAYSEGDPATVVDGALTVTDADDTDLEGATVSISTNFEAGDDLVFVDTPDISGAYNSGTGVLTLTGTASVADYQTALRSIAFQHTGDDPATAKTVSFVVNDGDTNSNTATKNIAITGVNDAPTLNTTGTNLNYLEGSGPVAVDDSLTASDPDSTNLQGAIVQITSNFAQADDELAFVNTPTITGVYNDTIGALTLSGTDTIANYQSALRAVTYENVSNNPTGTKTVSFQATDADGAASGIAQRTIDLVGSNSAPVVTASGGSTSYTEGDPATVVDGALTVTDADDTDLESATVTISVNFEAGDDLVFVNTANISGVYNTGTGVLTLTGTDTIANYQAALRSIEFQSTNDNPATSKTVSFVVNDGDNNSNTATKDITITRVNDAPTLNTTGANLNYLEGSGAVSVDTGITVSDPDSTNLQGATVQITGNFVQADDELAFVDTPTITGAYNDTTGTLTLSGTDTIANYQSALRAATYENVSNNPTGTKTVSFQATDADGATSGAATRTIDLTAVDSPAVATDDSATVLEDASASSVPVLTNDTDADGDPITISSASDPANGTVVLTGGVPGEHTGLTYQPDPNYCNDPPGTTSDTFTYTVNGGDTATVSMTVTCVNDPPVADDETFDGTNSAIGNTALVVNDPSDGAPALSAIKKSISGDILDGDTDVDGPGPLTVVAGPVVSNDGGSVTLEADGDFIFVPSPTSACTDASDFFDYTVSDGAGGIDNGRVTITITGCVWYVSNNAAGNAGTSVEPFDTLAQAETASGTGHTIFVFFGDGTSTGYANGIDLKATQRLLGEAATLTIGADTLHIGDPAKRPTLTDNNADVVALDDANEVKGLQLDPQGTGGGIAGAAGDADGTVDDVRVIDTGTAGTQPGLELDGTSGTFNISNLVIDNSAATGTTSGSIGVRLNNAGTVNFLPTGTISVTAKGAKALEATGTNMGAGSVFDDLTVTGSATGGVSMVNTTGTTQLGDGSGTDLDLTTTSGVTAALLISNGGTVSVPGTGASNISATGGPAVDVTGTAGAALALDDVDSTNSATDGINLAGLGTGSFSAASGDIGGAAGIAFDLDGGSGAITYPGNLNNGPGATADISGRSGGPVVLAGAIADGSDVGGGITVTGNSGGSTTFSNASKVLNTVTGNAVIMGSSDGHTLTFSGGGLDIDTTSGKGVEALTSGTLIITGTANSITTTTGTALNVTNTDIGAGGLDFDSISSNGASSGIILNATGTAGGLTVIGNAGSCTIATPTCSGGLIQNSVGSGIDLTNTRDVNLTRIRVQASGGHGITATAVTNLTLSTSFLEANGNGDNEHGLRYFNSGGTLLLDATTFLGAAEDLVNIDNTATNLTFTVQGASHFEYPATVNTTTANSAILIVGKGASAITANVQNATFKNVRNNAFQIGGDTTWSGTSTATFSNNNVSVDSALSQPCISVPQCRGSGVTAAAKGTATLRFTAAGNTLTRASSGGAINLTSGDTSTLRARVQNNTASDPRGDGFIILQGGSSQMFAEVTGNNFTNVGGDALEGTAGEVDTAHNGGLNLLFRNNTFNGTGTNPDIYFVGGISMFQFGDADQEVCVALTGNTVTGNATPGGNDVYLQGDFGFPGVVMTYEGTGTGAVTPALVKADNPGVNEATVFVSSVNLSNGATCAPPGF